MNMDEPCIPWPDYRRWTMETAAPGCIALAVGLLIFVIREVISASHGVRHKHESLFDFFWPLAIGFVVGMSPLFILSLINWRIRVSWWIHIGRITTRASVQRIVGSASHRFRLFVKELRPFFMSFGTYVTNGGWSSMVLRDEETGTMWVVLGKLPCRDED